MTNAVGSPPVVATVLNYNGWADAVECVRSLLASSYSNLKMLVVDNCSTDDSAEKLAGLADGERVELLRTGENLGSVGGTVFAVREALKRDAEFIFALSNDMVVPRRVVGRLVEAMAGDSRIGIVQPKLVYYDRPQRLWSCGFMMNHWLARGTDLAGRIGRRAEVGEMLDVDMLIGGVMFIRRGLLKQVGFIDQRYFFQNEEYDFFDRVRQAGWLVKVVMDSSVLHKVGRTIGTESYERWYYATRNRLLYISERLPFLQRTTARAFFYCTRPIKFCRWLLGGRPELIKASLEGWRDYRRSRLGRRLGAGDPARS